MVDHQPAANGAEIWQEVLGYLNFSSGTPDPRFLRNLNKLFDLIENSGTASGESAIVLFRRLTEELTELTSHSAPFANPEQARSLLRLIFEHVLPAYREHHRDLLFHLPDGELLRPFFIGRVAEAVLAEGPPWDETERLVAGALVRLNDFIGHRPVAVLHSSQKIEPYSHERVRPVPLYIAGAGVAVGRYRSVVALALDLLRSTDRSVLEAAWFDPALLDELALDPRAYDFNHPVNKRPNYHFGQWDPHHLDRQGRYRRFVLQQVTLDALLERVEAAGSVPRDELMCEAATVLAGIILMASGTSGNSPQAHDSSTTLGTLLPQIAAYRDIFYRQLFERLSGSHGDRLRAEAAALHQPFAAARQHLNAQLSRRRALQMQHVHLAQLFARLGFPDAALRQVQIVPAVSARIVCQIHCLVTAAHRAAVRGRLGEGMACLTQIEDLLHRGIECGAIVDPWNILGFGGQFSLFPAVENSIPDPRVDELLELMEQVFNALARLWHHAAAGQDVQVLGRLPDDFRRLTEWWDQFASEAISGLRWVSGREAFAAAKKVADALSAWHKAGASGGDLSFWRPYVDEFDSPQAYAWVVEALLEKRDLSAAMALLVHWIGQAERVRLDEGPHSFHGLAERWMATALTAAHPNAPHCGQLSPAKPPAADGGCRLIGRFFDFLEANAEAYWEVPELESAAAPRRGPNDDVVQADFDLPGDDEDEDDVYRAAYDEMVYRDSTADGVEGSILESGGQSTDFEFEGESNRLARRLAFLGTLARLWKQVAVAQLSLGAGKAAVRDVLAGWRERATQNGRRLSQLAADMSRQTIPRPTSGHESLLEFDRRMSAKEAISEKIIATCLAMDDAKQFITAALSRYDEALPDVASTGLLAASRDDPLNQLWEAALVADEAGARRHWAPFLAAVRQQPLLYVRLARGGEPEKIASVRGLQQMFRELLSRLPRLGMLRETCQLIQTARAMERDHPLGPGAVTEFDRLFEIGFKAIVETVVDSSAGWSNDNDPISSSTDSDAESSDADLIDCLQQVTESLLPQWGSHSHTLRLSALEKVASEKDWNELVAFIKRYGHDLFTQTFFGFGNLRAIMHQGIEAWLEQLSADPEAHDNMRLIADLDGRLPRNQARRHLGIVIEAVMENYAEYRDYNATTTQSDQGELLYTLLDFLRVKAAYDRIHWNLRPVTMVHEVLVRRGHDAAARLWCRAMAKETSATADQQLRRLAELQKKYGMRLSTIADRLGERFIRPLAIDRVRALVRPAAEEARRGLPPKTFSILESEASELAREPTGAGLDLPDWLAVIEDEIERSCDHTNCEEAADGSVKPSARIQLSWEQIQEQLTNWEIRRLEKAE
ncbi:MAG TPA: hypothetical protein VG056_07740 [Pirellulales bacterium]|jgi:hypothetical protein|nr:hypothetical protein [Pirellulales bacterium]